MNKMQQIALQVYGGGDFAGYTSAEDAIEHAHTGDNLLSFLLTEIGDDEDCSDVETAIHRLEVVIADVQVIIDALED